MTKPVNDKAQDFIRRAEAAGSKLTVKGHWVVATPPLPVQMMIELGEISDDVAAIIQANPAPDK